MPYASDRSVAAGSPTVTLRAPGTMPAAEVGVEGHVRRHAAAPGARELDAARAMQRSLLPAVLPSVDGCEVAALWRPAGAVGGDSYDVTRLSETRLALSIADVAGKGVPAALLMAHLVAMTRAYAAVTPGPRDLVGRLNDALCANTAMATLVTSCHAVLDMASRTLVVSNAGHIPPVLVRADGTAVRFATGGPVLGVVQDASYEQEEVTLRSGDRLLFYTDGVTEARSPGGVEYGDARLVQLLKSCGQAPAMRLIESVLASVSAFSGALEDDVALLAVAIL